MMSAPRSRHRAPDAARARRPAGHRRRRTWIRRAAKMRITTDDDARASARGDGDRREHGGARARARCARSAPKARRQWIAPVRVVRQRSRTLRRVRGARADAARATRCAWTLDAAHGRRRRAVAGAARSHGGRARRVDARAARRAAARLSRPHDRAATADGTRRRATQRLIVVPARCMPPERGCAAGAAFGITANLYTVRSARNWGAGDLGDLDDARRVDGARRAARSSA